MINHAKETQLPELNTYQGSFQAYFCNRHVFWHSISRSGTIWIKKVSRNI